MSGSVAVRYVAIEDGVFVVGGRQFRAAEVTSEDLKSDGRYDFRSRRAALTFDNGWTLSTIWGSCTYSSNHDHSWKDQEFTEQAETVEIAAWWLPSPDADEAVWYTFPGGDTVKGYVTVDELEACILDIAQWSPASPAGAQ